MYSLQRTVAPAVEPLTLALVKSQCRLDTADTSQDALLLIYIQAAREFVEQQTGRSVITQTWKLTRDRFPGSSLLNVISPVVSSPLADGWNVFGTVNQAYRIPLPRGPVLAVEVVNYFDPLNGLQAVDPATYVVVLGDTPCIAPVFGSCWPCPAWRPDAVQITYSAGYGPTAAAVPATLQLAMLLLVGHWNENREATQAALQGNGPMPLPLGIDAMLADYTDLTMSYEV